MKLIIHIFFILLLFNCSKTKKKEDQLLVVKNNFSVSGFYKKLDSLNEARSKNNSLEAPITITNDERLNKNYVHGAIHFLILDKDNSYYIIDHLKPFILLCGNTGKFLKQDSIDFIEKSNLLTDQSRPIKTSEITKILKQHQNAIVNTENTNPLNISFALKNDTLEGSTMYRIISFMENNGMKSYTIRRMNTYELKKFK